MKVLVINAPCNGFGDVVFAYKLYLVLKRAKLEVFVLTTYYEAFQSLGAPMTHVFKFSSRGGKNCRRFKGLDVPTRLPHFGKGDVVINAPLQYDFDPDPSDMTKVVGREAKLIVLTEYNHPHACQSIFGAEVCNTGLGKCHLGLLPPTGVALAKVSLPMVPRGAIYTVAYMGGGKESTHAPGQFAAYMDALMQWCDRQKKSVHLLCEPAEFVPTWKRKAGRSVSWPTATTAVKGKGTLHIHTKGVFPLPYKKMLSLWAGCKAPLLCTGDQSISDVIWKSKVDIYYQVAIWKEEFAKALATRWRRSRLIRLAGHKKIVDLLFLPQSGAPKLATLAATSKILALVRK